MPDQNNEQGSILLITVVFILIVTVMVLVATQTSIFEIKASENNRQYNENIAAAEAALIKAIANFRQLKDLNDPTNDISRVLNDTKYSDFSNAVFVIDSNITFPNSDPSIKMPIAKLEICRIVNENAPSCDGTDDPAFCLLSKQAQDTPKLSHRYYAGSIDKRRFAVTATAYNRDTNVISSAWVQKGISLPAEQDKDVL